MTSPRILFYCHNAIGLGHVIRSLRIADAALHDGARCAIVTGCRSLPSLDVDSRIDVEILPPVRIDDAGRPVALLDDVPDIIAVRSRRIADFISRWRPHAVVVDHHPFGLGGELVGSLDTNADARFILGIPYVEALPVGPFRNPQLRAALARYTEILDYSDDGASASVALIPSAVITRVGVVCRPPLPPLPTDVRRVVALAGGGQAAADLYRIVIDAMRNLPDWHLRLVVGPFGDAHAVETLARERGDVEVWNRGTAEEAVRDATVVVSRCGYNTAYALVQSALPIVFLPQRLPADDQIARAGRLSELPKIWNLDTRDPDVSAQLARVLHDADLTPVARTLPFAIDGAHAAAREIVRMIVDKRPSGP